MFDVGNRMLICAMGGAGLGAMYSMGAAVGGMLAGGAFGVWSAVRERASSAR